MARRGGAAWSRTMAVLAAAALAASACGSPENARSQAQGDEPRAATRSRSPEPARPQLLSATAILRDGTKARDDAPVERLGPVPPTNHTSYTWDAEVQDTTVAASSTKVVRSEPPSASLWTSFPREDSRVEAELINETRDRALQVQGHVVYELRGPGGRTEHSSEPLNLTLGPGQKLVVEFLLQLPSGDYEGSSSFRPEQDGGAGS